MDMQRVDMFIMTNQKYLPAEKIPFLRDRLLQCDPQRWAMISSVEMKDPTTLLLLSLFLGLLPTRASAASSSEIRKQINQLKEEKEEIKDKIKEVQEQYEQNENEIANLVMQKMQHAVNRKGAVYA